MTDYLLRCVRCDQEQKEGEGFICVSCGANLEVIYDYSKPVSFERETAGLARYIDLLPLKSIESLPPLTVGLTTLYLSPLINKAVKMESVYIKDEGRNPSFSFKDRASAVALGHFLESGSERICGASTGNAASSLACLSASMGIQPVIFVPESAPRAKIVQLLVYGAKVFCVRGTYDDAFELSLETSKRLGWYNRNTGFNPFTREGKKTVSFEIFEQLDGTVPDWVVVPVGDGNIISGVEKGFHELLELGRIERPPRLLAVQAEGSSAIFNAFKEGERNVKPVRSSTVADSISVDLPRDGETALRAVRRSGGSMVTVSDGEILDAILELGARGGVFAEPAAAAAFAGFKKSAGGLIGETEKVVILLTGAGLKDIDSAVKAVGDSGVVTVNPDVEEVIGLLSSDRDA